LRGQGLLQVKALAIRRIIGLSTIRDVDYPPHFCDLLIRAGGKHMVDALKMVLLARTFMQSKPS
jgi:hypothetical protein